MTLNNKIIQIKLEILIVCVRKAYIIFIKKDLRLEMIKKFLIMQKNIN